METRTQTCPACGDTHDCTPDPARQAARIAAEREKVKTSPGYAEFQARIDRIRAEQAAAGTARA